MYSVAFVASRPRLAGLALAGLLTASVAIFGKPAHAGELLSGQNVGLVGGAVAGGLVGNRLGGPKHKLLGTAAGVLGGGAVGGVVGTMIDDRKTAQPAVRRGADPVTTGSIGDRTKSLVNGQNIGIVAGAVGGGAVGGIVGNMIDKR